MLGLEQNTGPAVLKNRAGFQLGREKRRVMSCDLSISACEERGGGGGGGRERKKKKKSDLKSKILLDFG